MRKVRVPVMPDRMSHTSLTDLPRISMPFTSSTSSPSCSRPLFSAAPPRTIRPIITASPSFRTVAPCNTQKQLLNDRQHCTCSMSTVRTAMFCHELWMTFTFLHMMNRQQVVCNIEGLGPNRWNCLKCHCHRKLSATSDTGWQNGFLRHIFIEELPCLYSAQSFWIQPLFKYITANFLQ